MGVHPHIQPGKPCLSVFFVVTRGIMLVPMEMNGAPPHPVPAEERVMAQNKPPPLINQFIVIFHPLKVGLAKGRSFHIAIVIPANQIFPPLKLL